MSARILILDIETAPNIATKVCTNCKEELPASSFHTRKLRSGNHSLREHCKPCRRVLAKECHKGKDKQLHTLNAIKARAAKKGLPLNLEYDDITPPEFCPVFGFKLKRYSGKAGPDSPSVDKIIPSLGYVKGNIQIISLKANMMKHDASKEDLERFAKWVLRQKS